MRFRTPALAATAVLVAAAALLAAPAPAAAKGPGHCPPGLAKKNPPCVPPGLATRDIGDYYDERWIRIGKPGRYQLPRLGEGEGYYRDGRIVYRVNEETRRIIALILLADAIVSD